MKNQRIHPQRAGRKHSVTDSTMKKPGGKNLGKIEGFTLGIR